MSQESHRLYKKLVPLEKKYKYYKRCMNSGNTGGINPDTYPDMILRYRYDYLKIKLEHDTITKKDDIEETREMIKNKLQNNTELILLRRTVKLLKIQLIKNGVNKIYL